MGFICSVALSPEKRWGENLRARLHGWLPFDFIHCTGYLLRVVGLAHVTPSL